MNRVTMELLAALDPNDQQNKLNKADPKMAPSKIVKIGAGALLVGFDIGSRFIPMLNAVTAQQAVTSVASGVVLVADGFARSIDSK